MQLEFPVLLACLISDAEAAAVPGASVPFSPWLSRLQWASLHQARNQIVQMSNSLTPGACRSPGTPGKGSSRAQADQDQVTGQCWTTEGLVPTKSETLAWAMPPPWLQMEVPTVQQGQKQKIWGPEEPLAGRREGAEYRGTGSCSATCSIPWGCCCCKQSLPKDTGGCAERVDPTDPDWSKRTALCAEGK